MSELRTRPDLARRVSQIDAANVHDVHVILDGDPAVVRLGETQFAERLGSYVSLQATLREQVPDIDYVDVRFGDRVYVGVAESAGAGRRRAASPCQPATRARGCNGRSGSGTRWGGRGQKRAASGRARSRDVESGGHCRRGHGQRRGRNHRPGVAESQGIRRGAVVNQEAAVESIRKAVEAAELTAGSKSTTPTCRSPDPHQGVQQPRRRRGGGRNREITRDDVRRAIDAARAVSLPGGREILHVLPQDFVVDDEDGIGNPIGMNGARLEVNVHIVTGSTTTTQNIVACVNKAASTCRSRCWSSSPPARPC